MQNTEGDVDLCIHVFLDESLLHVLENDNKNIERNCSEPMLQCGPILMMRNP